MTSTTRSRCAACKYLRRRCSSDCIFSPYFPSDNPQRFSCVHRIYGASNVGKMLQKLPVHLRAEAANSLYFEAHSRQEDPVYGCVGIITNLHEEIHDVENELAKIQAHLGIHRHSNNPEDGETSQSDHGPQQQQ
ncbi:LOB domain-containing protein [Heracleum sosnowskyi]|uniref:LOB domain-containing protein n=1 Tax=Heracleum sosnowskyi TaxID=360622 RepID=A0AAD8N5X8_9APIA|nr:LOB domain-containing protein [Heracleum sosnowskyi]